VTFKYSSLQWVIWAPCLLGAAGLWGTILLGGDSNAFIGLTYIGGAGAFILVGGSFLYNLFELCRRDQEGITTSRKQDRSLTHWGHLILECIAVPGFISGLIFTSHYRLTLVFVCLLLGYPSLRWLASRRTTRNRVTLYRVSERPVHASTRKARG